MDNDRSAPHYEPQTTNTPLRHEGRLSNGAKNYNTTFVSSDNQKTKGSDEEVAVGGGSFTGLAPMAVADVNSTIASPV